MWFSRSRHKHARLRVWMLHVLDRSAKSGAEIMDEMEAMSRGWWRPSPAEVYPLLEVMTAEGAVRKMGDGRYEMTEKGREEARGAFGGSRQVRTPDEALSEMASYVSYLEDLKASDKTSLSPHSEKIKEVQARLSRLTADAS